MLRVQHSHRIDRPWLVQILRVLPRIISGPVAHTRSIIFHGCSRIKGCSEFHESGRVGPGSAKKLTGRVGSSGFQISRVGSDRVKRFSNLTGRIGSGRVGSRGHEKLTGLGSGHDQ